jgi:hypothetical protein
MLAYLDKTKLILMDNGTWIFENDKGSGNWGSSEEDGRDPNMSEYNLGFTKSEIEVSNHNNQYNGVSAYIEIIDGIDVLRLEVSYTFDNEYYDGNTNTGKIEYKRESASSSVKYYFFKVTTSDIDKDKLLSYFKNEENRKIGELIREEINLQPDIIVWTCDNYKNLLLDEFIAGSLYNIRNNENNINDRIALILVYIFNNKLKEARDMVEALNSENQNTADVNIVRAIVEIANGKRDFSKEEIYNCGDPLYVQQKLFPCLKVIGVNGMLSEPDYEIIEKQFIADNQ